MDSNQELLWLIGRRGIVQNWGACFGIRNQLYSADYVCVTVIDANCQMCSDWNQISLDHSSHIHSSLILAVTSSSCACTFCRLFLRCPAIMRRVDCWLMCRHPALPTGVECFLLCCALALTTRTKPSITRSILRCEWDCLREFTSLLRVFSDLHFSSLLQSCEVLVRYVRNLKHAARELRDIICGPQ